jgi:hypothetical protein
MVSVPSSDWVNVHLIDVEQRDGHRVEHNAVRLLGPHPRARVWEQERHRHLPAWALRHAYRLLIRPNRFLSARGSRRSQ